MITPPDTWREQIVVSHAYDCVLLTIYLFLFIYLIIYAYTMSHPFLPSAQIRRYFFFCRQFHVYQRHVTNDIMKITMAWRWQRSFAVSGLTLWNSLPSTARDPLRTLTVSVLTKTVIFFSVYEILYHSARWSFQGRINYCAGCSMGGGPPPPGAPDQLPNFFPRWFDVWPFSVGLNVTTKKVVNFLGQEKCTLREEPPEKILATRTRKWPQPYVGMGSPNG